MLTALIAKAEKIEVQEGDAIMITFAAQNIKDGAATRWDSLAINLRGNRWQETRVVIKWKPLPLP